MAIRTHPTLATSFGPKSSSPAQLVRDGHPAVALARISTLLLSSLLNGRGDLSGDMALRIEKAFGVQDGHRSCGCKAHTTSPKPESARSCPEPRTIRACHPLFIRVHRRPRCALGRACHENRSGTNQSHRRRPSRQRPPHAPVRRARRCGECRYHCVPRAFPHRLSASRSRRKTFVPRTRRGSISNNSLPSKLPICPPR